MQSIILEFFVIIGSIKAYLTRAKVEQKLKCRKQSHAAVCFPYAATCQVPIQIPESSMPRHALLVPRHDTPG